MIDAKHLVASLDVNELFKLQEAIVARLADTTHPALTLKEIDALKEGNKIKAIKLVRERVPLSLYDAKKLVDDWIANNPF